MLGLLWLVPALPLAGAVVLLAAGRRMGERTVAAVGAGAVGLAAVLASLLAVALWTSPAPGGAVTQELWRWFAVGDLAPAVALRLDALSLVFVLVVTWVGFLIHVYSAEYMHGDEVARFFAAMNLFVFAMLMLVLADNLVLLLLGWEGVGLCSYLLIGFWYEDPANGRAARKAFVVTRIGDTALTIAMFVLFWELGTLDIQPLLARAAEQWPVGSGLAVATALLILGGAVGKSAQLPLQTWLPDAMAGPTPVSALIHAATMVTAGVYLIARTHTLFQLAPAAQAAVAVVGAATLLLAGFAALAQDDIKRILAYSTISQIGYMFLALGVGAWSAAVLHFMTHAFFKALLFLAAGAVILAVHHEQDIFKMGGLRRELPVTFWTFLIGAAALAGFPLITSGFYSKDLILWHAFAAGGWHLALWAAGVVTAFVTALYSFRLIFVVFFGEAGTAVGHRPTRVVTVPLIVLAVLSLVAGFVELPHNLGDVQLFSGYLETTLPAVEVHADPAWELPLQLLAGLAAVGGIALAWYLWVRRPAALAATVPRPQPGRMQRLLAAGWGFDGLYDRLVVRPFVRLAHAWRGDPFDWIVTGFAQATELGHHALVLTQSGRVRWYAAVVAAGAVLLSALAVLS